MSFGSEEACCRWKAGVATTEKNRRIAIDEELLITGVSVSEENQRVLNDGVSASWMNDEGLLANGVSGSKGEAKQLLDGIVSSMVGGKKDDGKEMKNDEQWCFSIGESGWKVADNRCFSNRRKMQGCWCFSNGKSCCEWCCSRGRGRKKSETSAGRSCFGSENDGGMGCFCDWEEVKKCRKKVFRRRGNSHQCFSAVFQHRRNEQCCTTVFQHHEKSSVLHNGVPAS
jgi:hypothetical protein